VLQLWKSNWTGCDNSNESSFNSKHTNNKAMEQTNLRRRRAFARLAFADHMDGLLAGEGAPRGPKRAKMLIRIDPSLDRAVVLFQNIVEVLHRPVLAAGVQRSFTLEL
jgi:hypothetical protein